MLEISRSLTYIEGKDYEYSFPVSEFRSIYKANCKALNIKPPKKIEVKATNSELEFSFTVLETPKTLYVIKRKT